MVCTGMFCVCVGFQGAEGEVIMSGGACWGGKVGQMENYSIKRVGWLA